MKWNRGMSSRRKLRMQGVVKLVMRVVIPSMSKCNSLAVAWWVDVARHAESNMQWALEFRERNAYGTR